ncbi:MAG: molybdenum ABC transporter ATP-binding protein [Cypionkella sp.]|jgi:molybdate transport system ATP-binding protein|nr:molybdenum ABC transporter ATP-binding protein [Cypionkella sp.]
MTVQIALTHRFGGFALDVAFDAPPGVTALFGRSGSGKTTTINAVAGLFRPDQGRITLDGVTLLDSGRGLCLPPHRRRIGYVFQDARLFPHMTVRQNLAYGQWFAPKGPGVGEPGVGLDRIVDLLGIGALLERRPGGLSGGEKQRVAIGRALLSRPRLLALDEPLAALDDARKAEILPYLERLRDELHLPMLYVSHAMAEVARLATTVVVLEAGRVVAAGPAADVLSDPAAAPTLGLREAGALLGVRVAAHDVDGLTRLDSAAGPLWLPQLDAPPGTALRIRILAQDVILATERPQHLSALNVLPAVIRDIRLGDGPGALIRLDAGGETILARITRRSAQTLGLVAGQNVFAILKALSVAQQNVGATRAPRA